MFGFRDMFTANYSRELPKGARAYHGGRVEGLGFRYGFCNVVATDMLASSLF